MLLRKGFFFFRKVLLVRQLWQYTFNFSTLEAEAGGSLEFKAREFQDSQSYTERNTVLKNQKEKKKNKKHLLIGRFSASSSMPFSCPGKQPGSGNL